MTNTHKVSAAFIQLSEALIQTAGKISELLEPIVEMADAANALIEALGDEKAPVVESEVVVEHNVVPEPVKDVPVIPETPKPGFAGQREAHLAWFHNNVFSNYDDATLAARKKLTVGELLKVTGGQKKKLTDLTDVQLNALYYAVRGAITNAAA